MERTAVFEHGPDEGTDEGTPPPDAHCGGFGGAMLRGVSVVSHQVLGCGTGRRP